MAEITLAKMGRVAHLHKPGSGRPAKYSREKDKPGILNVDNICWITGLHGDEKTYPSFYKPVIRNELNLKRK